MKSINLLVVFLTISTIQHITEAWKENIEKITKQCIQETNADPQFIIDALANHQYPDDPQFKKFIFCFSIKFGTVDKSGNLNPEFFWKNLGGDGVSDSVIEEILEKCTVSEGTPEERTYRAFLCYQETAPEDERV
nr:odorant-binding protein 17 [Lytta caraganae]